MNKKISLGLAIALIVLSVTASFAITMSVSQRMYNKLITDLPKRAQMYDAVEEVDKIVRSKYYGDIDEAMLDSNLENGYINGLGDKYSRYMNADAYKLYSSKLEGRSAGIGVEVETDPVSGYLLITEVYPNSPAQTEGLQKGDRIVAIGDDTVTAENSAEMAGKLSGIKLTSVSLTYRRDDVDKSVNVVLGYTNQTVSYELIGTVGYIKISAFYKNTLNQLEKAITQLKKEGAKSLIFDVRSTYDGTVEYTCRVIDLLVPTATEGNKAIATLVDKTGKTVKTYSSDSKDIIMPMAVLINSDTAGCGELFACDLKDFATCPCNVHTPPGRSRRSKRRANAADSCRSSSGTVFRDRARRPCFRYIRWLSKLRAAATTRRHRDGCRRYPSNGDACARRRCRRSTSS